MTDEPNTQPEPQPEPEPELQEQEETPAAAEGDPVEQDSDVTSLRGEAANRRRQLRAVEAERDQLRKRVDDHDRQTVEQQAGALMQDPSDLWIFSSLDELRNSDGALDEEKISDAVKGAVERKPHWQIPQQKVDFHAGVGRGVVEQEKPSFGDALKKAVRHR